MALKQSYIYSITKFQMWFLAVSRGSSQFLIRGCLFKAAAITFRCTAMAGKASGAAGLKRVPAISRG
jgi:hypothetical protein